MPVFPLLAYTQTVMCLYPNGRASIPKRLFGNTQFETHSKNDYSIMFRFWFL